MHEIITLKYYVINIQRKLNWANKEIFYFLNFFQPEGIPDKMGKLYEIKMN